LASAATLPATVLRQARTGDEDDVVLAERVGLEQVVEADAAVAIGVAERVEQSAHVVELGRLGDDRQPQRLGRRSHRLRFHHRGNLHPRRWRWRPLEQKHEPDSRGERGREQRVEEHVQRMG
jgi:hypothetical protein